MKQAPFLYSLGIHAILFVLVGLLLSISQPFVPNSTVYVDLIGIGTGSSGSGGGSGAGTVLPSLDLPSPVADKSVTGQSENRDLSNGQTIATEQERGSRYTSTMQPGRSMIASSQYEYGNGTVGNSGNGSGNGQGDGSGTGSGSGNDLFGSGFARGADGIYTALSADEVDYTILSAPDPIYPETAYEAGYTRTVQVQVRLYVDTDGSITQVEFLDTPPDLGFREEIEKIIYQWRFAPLYYRGQPIRLHFLKTFRFER